MADVFVTTILAKVISSIALALGKPAVQKILESPALANSISNAVLATAGKYPEIEPLDFTLRKWRDSNGFQALISRIYKGEQVPDHDVISSFIDDGGFAYGYETSAKAAEILTFFAESLESELLGTDEADKLLGAKLNELKTTSNKIKDQTSLIPGIDSKVDYIFQALTSDKSKEPNEEKALHAKIDVTRDLIRRGKFNAAKELLISLREEIASTSASLYVHFRIATNLGSCHIQLEDYDSAVSEFEAAFRLQPNEPMALANAFHAALLKGKNNDDALGWAA